MRRRFGRADRARVSWWLALPLAALLAGCSRTTPNDHSRAGLEAAAKDLVANLESARYRRACEDLTSEARLRLAVFPTGGCSGALAFARGLLVVDGSAQLGQRVEKQLRAAMRHVTVHDDEARVAGVVLARYEQGAWGFETASEAAPRQRLKTDLEAALTRLRGDGAERLLGQLQVP
jgi:hypothetical protein